MDGRVLNLILLVFRLYRIHFVLIGIPGAFIGH